MSNTDLISKLYETSQALEQLALHLSQLPDANAGTDVEPKVESETAEATAESDEPAAETNAEAEAKTEEEAETTETTAEAETEPEPAAGKTIVIDIEPAAAEEVKPEPKNNPNGQNNPFAKMMNGLLNNKPNANPLQLFSSMLGGGGLGNLNGLMGGGLGGLSGLAGLGGSLPTSLAELQDNPQILNLLKNVSNNPQMLNTLSTLTGQDSQTLQQALQSLQTSAPTAPAAAAAPEAPLTTVAPMAAAAPNSVPAVSPYLNNLLNEWHWQPYARAWTF